MYNYTGGGDILWITPPCHIPPLAWGPTPPQVGVSPLPSCQNVRIWGIIPSVNRKKFLGKLTPISKIFSYRQKKILVEISEKHNFVKKIHIMTRLELATKKFYQRMEGRPYLGMTLEEYILECYLDYPPSSYGKYIQEKIIFDCERIGKVGIQSVSDRKNNGDCKLVYPFGQQTIVHEDGGKKYVVYLTVGEKYYQKLNFEIKCSFLGKKGYYTIRNLRPYQEIKGGYILCLIDCENDFQPQFFVINSDALFREFTLSHMNGTNEQHTDGSFENYGITIKKDSSSYDTLKELNLLSGTNIEDLYTYLNEKYSELKSEFNSNKEHIKELRDSICEYFEKKLNLNIGDILNKKGSLL